ncbi:MAG: DUF721 domain-containing protein [Candidatus Omnitrophica bacterium]|nr:DUF721 domain-containing protein [Candidatus Omnitrophota bacterium]
MAADSPQPVSAILSTVLRQMEQQHSPLAAIQGQWRALVGKRLAAHTTPVSLRRGRLVVYVERPGDGFILNYQRGVLLEQVRALTQGKVEELVIRPGPPTA